MDLTIIGYLLLIVPGFCFVWTYRHFSKLEKIGDFEYAIWSFLWGFILFLLTVKYIQIAHISLPPTSTNEPISFASASLGIGFSTAILFSFPLGYIGAFFYRIGLFSWINKRLLQLLELVRLKK